MYRVAIGAGPPCLKARLFYDPSPNEASFSSFICELLLGVIVHLADHFSWYLLEYCHRFYCLHLIF